jgi:type IV secretion system protein VirB10
VGAIAGSVAGRGGMGAGVGAGAGAAAALAGVLLTRGPDAVLAKGTTLEMVVDRDLIYDDSELTTPVARGRASSEGVGPLPSQKRTQVPVPGREPL